jgi:4-hydroxy-2-oxoheptanedioate aldolase
MNKREFNCSKILTDLIENDGLVGIKTSFEDEGATFNETIRLKEICNQSKTKLTLKVGGPEAVRDIKDSLVIGVKGIVAPMVESPFGLQKFINAVHTYVPKDILPTLQLNINVETIQGVEHINEILDTVESNSLYGVTVGRVDLVSSLNKDRGQANSQYVFDLVRSVFEKVKEKGLKACLGGAISTDSLDFLKKLNSEGLLDKFETRYAIFDPAVTLKNLSRALGKAQLFEFEWLSSKQEMYSAAANQDGERIKMIQSRINQSANF